MPALLLQPLVKSVRSVTHKVQGGLTRVQTQLKVYHIGNCATCNKTLKKKSLSQVLLSSVVANIYMNVRLTGLRLRMTKLIKLMLKVSPTRGIHTVLLYFGNCDNGQ